MFTKRSCDEVQRLHDELAQHPRQRVHAHGADAVVVVVGYGHKIRGVDGVVMGQCIETRSELVKVGALRSDLKCLVGERALTKRTKRQKEKTKLRKITFVMALFFDDENMRARKRPLQKMKVSGIVRRSLYFLLHNIVHTIFDLKVSRLAFSWLAR